MLTWERTRGDGYEWRGGVPKGFQEHALVGERTRARRPPGEWAPRRVRRGTRKASVLPLPVGAHATRSRRLSITGHACICGGGWKHTHDEGGEPTAMRLGAVNETPVIFLYNARVRMPLGKECTLIL